MYDHILFPTDGSDGADTALEHAVDHARRYDATLHLLYVVEENVPMSNVGAAELVEALREEGTRIVADARTRAEASGVDAVRETVETGSPYRTILEYADDHAVDLIVMGTHGRRGIDRYLLGSVAERVVRTADCPVLTARADEHEDEA